MNGENDMRSEGGIHVPFVVAWPGNIPGSQTYASPISTLDVAAAAAALANIQTQPDDLDAKNIVPYLTGEIKTVPHETIYWRWVAQAANRAGNWKLLRGGDRESIYDHSSNIEETRNLTYQNSEIATGLRNKLNFWSRELTPPGPATGRMEPAWDEYFEYDLEGKAVTDPSGEKANNPGRRRQRKVPEPQN